MAYFKLIGLFIIGVLVQKIGWEFSKSRALCVDVMSRAFSIRDSHGSVEQKSYRESVPRLPSTSCSSTSAVSAVLYNPCGEHQSKKATPPKSTVF
jgi:hypothetical protein